MTGDTCGGGGVWWGALECGLVPQCLGWAALPPSLLLAFLLLSPSLALGASGLSTSQLSVYVTSE